MYVCNPRLTSHHHAWTSLLRSFSGSEKRTYSLAVEGCLFFKNYIRKDNGLKLSSAK